MPTDPPPQPAPDPSAQPPGQPPGQPLDAAFLRRWTAAQPLVAAFLASLVRDRHAVDDLLQEVALVAWRKHAQYDPRQPFTAWALGIARLAAADHRRRAARSPLVVVDPTDLAEQADIAEGLAAAFATDADELAERAAAVRACVAGLPPRGWDYVRLRYHEGLAPGAIAERLGLEANAVRVALHRLRTVLAECISRRLGRDGARP